jgi:hypothetical protein
VNYTPALRSKLRAALEAEHVERCGSSSCDIQAAFDHELYLWAAHLLVNATDEGIEQTEELLGAIDPSEKDLDAERDYLVRSVRHATCPACNAVNWSRDHFVNAVERCSNCGRDFSLHTCAACGTGCSDEWVAFCEGCQQPFCDVCYVPDTGTNCHEHKEVRS